MMSGDTHTSRRVLCQALPPTKGGVFEEWVKDMLDAAGGEGDEDASWADTYLGLDPRVGLTPGRCPRLRQRRTEPLLPYIYMLQVDGTRTTQGPALVQL